MKRVRGEILDRQVSFGKSLMSKTTATLSMMLSLMLSLSAFAHEGHHHGTHSTQAKVSSAKPDVQIAYKNIQADYLNEIKPIFDKKCAACHSLENAAPWYASVPLAGRIVESDRSEAKEHLEISKGFPFAGHGTPEEDLTVIKNTVIKGEMPTFLYRFFHPSSRLTDQEKEAILAWVDRSEKKINELAVTEKSH